MRFIITLLLVFPFAATAQETDSVEMLFELDREFMEYRLKNGTYEAFSKYLTKDAVTLPQGVLPKIGLDAVLRDVVETPGVTVTWAPEAGDISGDLGYTWGHFIINTQQDDGTVGKQHGKYTTVWERQVNGDWKAAIESFSMNPAP